jgi:hypothetical protein
MEQFRSSINENISEVSGTLKFKMDYKIFVNLNETYSGVCRRVFAYCWGISEYEIKKISKALKISDGGYCDSYTTRGFNDTSNLGN